MFLFNFFFVAAKFPTFCFYVLLLFDFLYFICPVNRLICCCEAANSAQVKHSWLGSAGQRKVPLSFFHSSNLTTLLSHYLNQPRDRSSVHSQFRHFCHSQLNFFSHGVNLNDLESPQSLSSIFLK